MQKTIKSIRDLHDLTKVVLDDNFFLQQIEEVSKRVVQAYRDGHKTIFCGNGGSSAEAQHLAAELSGKFNIERKPIPAEACHVNSSFLTAVSNDYDFTKVYSRYVEAFGAKGDIFIGLSTSGTSVNIVEAFKSAKDKGMITVALTGKTGGDLNELSDFIFRVPSTNVPRIQEVHLLLGHIICDFVESELFGDAK